MITIPNHKARAWGASEGNEVAIENGPDDTMIIWPAKKPTPAFVTHLEQIRKSRQG